MRRREFIAGLSAAVAWPPALRAQPQTPGGRRLPKIGILNYASEHDALVNEFRGALKELGLAEGQSFSPKSDIGAQARRYCPFPSVCG